MQCTKQFKNSLQGRVIEIAKKASEEILEIYKLHAPQIEYKKDDSPLTKADIISNEVILNGLKEISNIPIVTEETNIDYETRKNWKKFWLVDPLDGTKDFIVKNGQFTVNIALIENGIPTLGVISIPAENTLYWATKNNGAYKDGIKINCNFDRKELIGSDSNFHSTQATVDFYEKYNITNIKRYGSALKFCKIAEGKIDVYARLNGTMEWDTAAGQIILDEAGGKMIDITTNQPIVYNRENQVNNYFVASRNDLELI